jgi:hypothetical protein
VAICEYEYGEFEYGGEQFEKQINHRGKREGNIARAIREGEGLPYGI